MTIKLGNKFYEGIKQDLFSNDEARILKAINCCKERGSAILVEPLIAFYASTDSEPLKAEVAEMLSTLKVSKVENYFIDALDSPAKRHIRKDILSFMWNSGIQPVNQLAVITKVALNGTFEEAFESLTLLESFETAIPEEALLESITLIRQYNDPGVQKEKATVIAEYLKTLEEMRMSADTE